MTKRQAPLWSRQRNGFLFFVCLWGCKNPADTPPPTDSGEPLQCEPLQVDLVQQFDKESLLKLFSGQADDLPEHQGPSLAMGDLNGDGFWDALLSVRSAGTIAFLNDGTGQFSVLNDIEVDGKAGFPEANSVALADMDADGDLDLAMATQDGLPNLLLINKGNGTHWESIVLEDSLGESLTPTWADLNGDGRLDLVIPGFGHKFPDPVGRLHSLYFQDMNGDLQLDRSALPQSARKGMVFIAQPLDVDLDGDLDLYYASELPFDSQLLLNDGSGIFTDHSEDCFCTRTATMGVAIGDTNLDGLPDLFVTRWQENNYFVNDNNGGFYDAAEALSLTPAHSSSEIGWGVRFTDFNLDGLPDLAGTFGGPTHDPRDHPKIQYAQNDALWIADNQGGFTDKSATAEWTTTAKGRGLFVADMNRDGQPDLVLATNIGLEIWLTKGGCGESLSLTLNGGSGDPHGEGARIRIEQADGTVHYEWMQSAVSFGNAAPELYLGNPKTNEIVGLEVQWADGQVQSIPIPKESSFFSFQRE